MYVNYITLKNSDTEKNRKFRNPDRQQNKKGDDKKIYSWSFGKYPNRFARLHRSESKDHHKDDEVQTGYRAWKLGQMDTKFV